MGKRKGSWRKFFCCASPPETQSSTCVNISESAHVKPPPESEQEDEDLYIEAEVQTSNVDIPEGNRWRWSRLHHEVEVQTSSGSLTAEEEESVSEVDAQMQTSWLSLAREAEAQVQTSFPSLRSPAPVPTEAQVQTSFAELPRKPCAEAQVQTSLVSLQSSSPSETEAQVQTSFTELPREPCAEAQVQTSFLSFRSPAPSDTEVQGQTSLAGLSRGSCVDAQAQTSLPSLPGEREAQAQTSFLSLPERPHVISIQVQPSCREKICMEKEAPSPRFIETQVQTSDLEMPPSEADIQIQTSFSDYMSEREETSSIETEQQSKRSSSQLSGMDFCTLYPLYIDAEAQTLPVEIPPGNDWRSARLKAAAQVQTSNISLEKPVPQPQGVIRVQPSTPTSDKSELLAEELEAPLSIKAIWPPPSIQTSSPEIQEEKRSSSQQSSKEQVHPSTIELLKKLSLLSQIETAESSSHTELLKKVSSLSVTDLPMQSSSYELLRKPSSFSDSATEGQVLNPELLRKRSSPAHGAESSDYELAGKPRLPSPPRELQMQTSDLELMKKVPSLSHAESQERSLVADLHKCSSLSLVEATDENQEEITEGREYLITPQLIEAQIRKWYHEFPEVQTASQAPVQREPLLSPTVDSEVQTSLVEIPRGNRWRASRLQADAEVQTSGLQSSVEEVKPCLKSGNDTETQTSLFEIWQARSLADAQIQTSDLGLTRTEVEPPPPLLIDSQVQTSLADLWKADVQTQTSGSELPRQMTEHPPIQPVDRLTQTSFLETSKTTEPDKVEQKAPAVLELKEEDSLLQADLGVQTSLLDSWQEEDKTDTHVQTSFLEIPEAQEELPLSSQTDAVVQTSDVEIPLGGRWRSSRLHTDVQLQTSMLDMQETETPPPSQMDTQVQTSLLDIWKTKDLRDSQALASQTGISPSLERPSLPSQPESVVQPPALETSESSPPSQMDTQVQTSLLDIWKTKDLRDARAQTSWTDMSPSLEEPSFPSQPESVVQPPTLETSESSPPSQMDTQVQTSLLDIWKTKDLRDARAQTSWTDMSPSLEEPPLPSQPEHVVQPPVLETVESSPPSQMDTQVQTSLLDIWKTKDLRDARAQTSWTDMYPSLEEPSFPSQPERVVQPPALETVESPPPSQMDTQVQTSLLDIWKTKDLRDARAQTSWTDMSPSLEEPSFPSQPERVVQPPALETAESSPPSQMDTQVQTSLLDIWKTKDVRDARAQTSWTDMSPSLEEPPLLSQPERVVQPPVVETVESSPPSQMDTEVQTSLLDIWKTKDVSDALAQTSQLDISESVEEPLFPSQPEDVVPSSALETTETPLPSQADTGVQTSFSDIWKAKELSNGQVQTSWSDLQKSMEEPLLQSQSESSVPIARPESSAPDQPPEKQTSLLEMWKTKEPMESSELQRSSSSPIDTKVQMSLSDTQAAEELPRAQALPSKADLESTVPSRRASPVCLPGPANAEAALLAQGEPELPVSLLEVWTTRQEAEVQKQTANLGLSFDKDSPLFPILLESQEEKKLEQISKVAGKSKPPVFTEAQVQTSFVEVPRGKKWRSSRLSTEAQVQTSFPDLHSKDRMPALQKMVSDHVTAKRVQKGPKRATPVSVHLHVKMSPKRRTSNEKKIADT
ncbi:uncharacterized protein LOC143820291 [Paroedura picta]|uniref:uncharacterized protein LOC143820291 n=1 Tax=Paroedura picta TaxID=143630 RepID=UPI00405773E6